MFNVGDKIYAYWGVFYPSDSGVVVESNSESIKVRWRIAGNSIVNVKDIRTSSMESYTSPIGVYENFELITR